MKNKIKTFADLNKLLEVGRIPSPEVQAKYKEFKSKNIPTKEIGELPDLAKEFNVSESCATDIWYLRSRNRWTQVLEDELIALFKAGTRPNMNEFGCTPETGEALLNAAIGSVVNNYTPTPDAY